MITPYYTCPSCGAALLDSRPAWRRFTCLSFYYKREFYRSTRCEPLGERIAAVESIVEEVAP